MELTQKICYTIFVKEKTGKLPVENLKQILVYVRLIQFSSLTVKVRWTLLLLRFTHSLGNTRDPYRW